DFVAAPRKFGPGRGKSAGGGAAQNLCRSRITSARSLADPVGVRNLPNLDATDPLALEHRAQRVGREMGEMARQVQSQCGVTERADFPGIEVGDLNQQQSAGGE